MGLTMKQRRAVTKEMALKYNRATKKGKAKILDALIELTGYNRSYAARVLRQRARTVVLGANVRHSKTLTLRIRFLHQHRVPRLRHIDCHQTNLRTTLPLGSHRYTPP